MPMLPVKKSLDPREKVFIPRSKLLEAFMQRINKSKNIKVLFSSSCNNIELKDGHVSLSVESDDKSCATKIMTPGLLLGCDGINSVVRTWLSDNENKSTGNKNKKNKFDILSVPSDSAGLKFKMMTVIDK